MTNGPQETKEGEDLPTPRGPVSEYIFTTHEVLEEHAQGRSKNREPKPRNQENLQKTTFGRWLGTKRIWIAIVILGALLAAAAAAIIFRR